MHSIIHMKILKLMLTITVDWCPNLCSIIIKFKSEVHVITIINNQNAPVIV